MRWLRSPASLHAARRLLLVARELQLRRRWRWWRASEPARGRSAHVLDVAWGQRRRGDVLAALRPAALARRWRPALQRAVAGRRRAVRRGRRRTRHVPLHGHVRGRRHVARAPRALGLGTAAHAARRRAEAVRQRRGRRRAEPLRRRHAERARRGEALARRARVLLAHGAPSARPAACRAPSRLRPHSVSHAARPLRCCRWPPRPHSGRRGCGAVPMSAFTPWAPWRYRIDSCLTGRPAQNLVFDTSRRPKRSLSRFMIRLWGLGEAKVRPRPRWPLSWCSRTSRLR